MLCYCSVAIVLCLVIHGPGIDLEPVGVDLVNITGNYMYLLNKGLLNLLSLD